MVRFSVLASGSKGNATVLTAGRTRVLVDCGLSCRELFRRMREIDEDPSTLDAILVTHEHVDHVNGIAVTARKLNIPVYFTEPTHHAWQRWIRPRRQMTYSQWLEQCRRQAAERLAAEAATAEGLEDVSDEPTGPLSPEMAVCAAEADAEAAAEAQATSTRREPDWLPHVEYFQAGQDFTIGDIDIRPFSTPHDAADPVGFVFRSEGLRLGFATDLGYMPPNVKQHLSGLDLLLVESNHDLEMLRDGPYPWSVKQRVLSRVGHLSNDATAQFLEQDYDGHAAWVILAHLSESNNLPDLAQVAAQHALRAHPTLLGNRLLLASQHEPLQSIYF